MKRVTSDPKPNLGNLYFLPVPGDTYRAIDEFAQKLGLNFTELLTVAVNEYINKHKEKSL